MHQNCRIAAMGRIDRRQALVMGAATTGFLLLEHTRARAADEAVAQTTAGKIRGYTDGPVKIFKGVPYGADTGGKN